MQIRLVDRQSVGSGIEPEAAGPPPRRTLETGIRQGTFPTRVHSVLDRIFAVPERTRSNVVGRSNFRRSK